MSKKISSRISRPVRSSLAGLHKGLVVTKVKLSHDDNNYCRILGEPKHTNWKPASEQTLLELAEQGIKVNIPVYRQPPREWRAEDLKKMLRRR